jgi:hypothetical protein
MSKGGSSGSSGSTQTIQKSDPWVGVQPYLTGSNIPGIYSEASRLYQQNQNMPQQMQDLEGGYGNTLAQRAASGITDYSVNNTPVAPVASQTNLDINAARSAQGVLNPTQAMQNMLTGRPDTQYLDQQAQALTQQANRNLLENIMPGIRSGAQASGQFGGSRQGIAEGLAASRVNQDLAPALTSMYSNALENAQQRMYGTAGQLNQQAESVGTGNLSRGMQQDQFNANLALQNNEQAIQQAQANAALQAQRFGLQDTTFNQQLQLAGMPQQYQQDQLQNYAGIIQPGTGIGGTSTSTQPLYQNNIGNALAGGMLGSMVGPALGASTGMGAGMGALGGLLLSSRKLKTKIGNIDADNVLESMNELPIDIWVYNGEEIPHIGTYAEDFAQAFGVGDGGSIPTVDAIGVLMLAVQALTKRVAQLECK